jgi:hypothetical protein
MSRGTPVHTLLWASCQARAVMRKVGGDTGSGAWRYASLVLWVARANSRILPRSTSTSKGAPLRPIKAAPDSAGPGDTSGPDDIAPKLARLAVQPSSGEAGRV